MKVKGHFGSWLYDEMAKDRGWTVSELSRKIKVCAETIYSDLRMAHRPPYSRVILYCWIFNSLSELETVWSFVKEDYGERSS